MIFMAIANCSIERIAIENPMGVMSTQWRKPDQIIQPYFFGDEARKTTCLWLKNLPKLVHTPVQTLFDTPTHVSEGESIEWVDKKTGKKKRQPKWYSSAKQGATLDVRSEEKEVKPLWVSQEQCQSNGIFNQIIKNNKPIIMNELKLGAVTVNLLDTKKAQGIFRALNHKLRQQIMLAIEEGTGKATVTDLYVKLRLEQSVCSQHLGIIRKVGLVKATRDGKCIFYSINYQMLSVVNEVSVTLLKAAK